MPGIKKTPRGRKRSEISLSDKVDKTYFAEKMKEALQMASEKYYEMYGEKFYEKDFAVEVGIIPNMISRYKKGEAFPSDEVFEKMIDVFQNLGTGIDKSFFLRQSPEEQYEFSKKYLKKLSKQLAERADDIGLDPCLLTFMMEKTDMGRYPLYRPLKRSEYNLMDNDPNPYIRYDLRSTEVDMDEYQIIQDDKKYMLHKIDLRIIRDFQDEIIDFIHFLYYKRSEEMKKEELQANSEYRKVTTQKDGSVSIACHPLDDEDLMRIDPYYKYAFERSE